MGGLARKATALAKLESEGHLPLIVDSGDLFFTGPAVTGSRLEAEMMMAETMLAGYNRLGTAAITIGESDLTAGLPYLLHLAEKATFPFVSSNLVDDDNTLLFAPYAIVERPNLRIAIVGVSSNVGGGAGYHFTEPISALRSALSGIREKADLVVLLLHGSDSDQALIERASLPIDLMLQSHLKGNPKIEPNHNPPVIKLGEQGKYLMALNVTFAKSGVSLVDVGDLERSISFAQKGIDRLGRNQPEGVPLERIYADKPDILKRLATLRDRKSQAEADLASAQNRVMPALIALSEKIESEPELLELVDNTLAEITARNLIGPDNL